MLSLPKPTAIVGGARFCIALLESNSGKAALSTPGPKAAHAKRKRVVREGIICESIIDADSRMS